MSDTHVVSETFPTLRAARSARERLAEAGFARNSIDIERQDDGFEVLISTREENRDRAERVLHGRSLGRGVGGAARTGRALVHENQILSLALAALAGVLLFGLTKRR